MFPSYSIMHILSPHTTALHSYMAILNHTYLYKYRLKDIVHVCMYVCMYNVMYLWLCFPDWISCQRALYVIWDKPQAYWSVQPSKALLHRAARLAILQGFLSTHTWTKLVWDLPIRATNKVKRWAQVERKGTGAFCVCCVCCVCVSVWRERN